MTSIIGRFENGALIVDVTNVAPDFDNPESMKSAMEDRKRWTTFLDKATGYNSKQRGDKAKEWAKKAAKAKSAVSSARHFMQMSDSIPADKIEKAESLIEEIESYSKKMKYQGQRESREAQQTAQLGEAMVEEGTLQSYPPNPRLVLIGCSWDARK